MTLRIDGAFDVECADWDVFCVGATFDGRDSRVYYDVDEMIDAMRERGGTWVAHAGGVYDMLLVLERARARGIPCQVDRSQHRVTRIVIGKLTMRDSYSIWPAPLDELCGSIGEPTPELPWACKCCQRCGYGSSCTCGRGCGGYCQISERARAGDPDLEDYVKADARKLYYSMTNLVEWASERGISVRGTLGQTAWVAARDELGIPPSSMPWHLWRHCRQGDKGGRIAIVRPRFGDLRRPPSDDDEVGAHHDICSAYPSQLARAELPVGALAQLGGSQASSALDRCRSGIYTVSVAVPDDLFLPPLPWHQAGMLCFPTGEFVGSWTLPELVAGLERGVDIREVHTAIIWETTAPVFAPLVERWYALRKQAGRRAPLGKWVSGLAKALTGKLAERPDRSRVVFYPDEIKVCTRQGACRDGCTKRCGAYEPMDLYGLIWGVPYHRMSPSAYPQWSAYLRSMTRVQWLSQAERMSAREDGAPDGGKAVLMGNTDSLWHTSRQTPEPLGDGLGYWEYKNAFNALEVRAPTIYAFRDLTGRIEIRGIPGLTEDDWARGRGAIDRGIVTFGRAVATTRGLFHRRHRRWSLPDRDRVWYGDRRLHSDGLTYPATADELRDLARVARERRRREDAGRESLGAPSRWEQVPSRGRSPVDDA